MNFLEYCIKNKLEAPRVAGVGGTDDGDARTLGVWFAALLLGVIEPQHYAGSIGPFIRPKRADGTRYTLCYSQSCLRATARVRYFLRAVSGKRLVVAYSQGAEAAGNGYESSRFQDDATLLLVADPRGWTTALKPWLSTHLLARVLVRRFGVELNDYRGDMKTKGGRVFSVAILGDPITAMEPWLRNPFGALSNLIAFFLIHSGLGKQSAQQLAQLEVCHECGNGEFRRVVLYATHPLVQLLYLRSGRVHRRWLECGAEIIAPRTMPGEESASLIRSREKIRQQLARIPGHVAHQMTESPFRAA